ncbi:unnamed protein product [Cylicostephanus goldi]|uniref:Uncharacterized protein n=1 Tax=Cylicostephanus goldi TaxID=71465 RepID=A0A3P7M8W6_CYLGO|nr:unnamed protein product [Cylicostephanus goldi]
MWWAGDVRDYWMALTILEIIAVFINVYCVVVVYMFMRRLAATTDEYEGKSPQVRYKVNRNGYTRKEFDDYPYDIRRATPEKIMKNSYPHHTTQNTSVIASHSCPLHHPLVSRLLLLLKVLNSAMRTTYPPYTTSEIPQTPLPMPPRRHTPVPPYPVDDREAC